MRRPPGRPGEREDGVEQDKEDREERIQRQAVLPRARSKPHVVQAKSSHPGHPGWQYHQPSQTIRKLHAGPGGHPFVGAGPDRRPCRAAPAAACNGDMNTEPQITQAPPLGHYEIDASQSQVTFRTRHMFGLGPVRGTFAIRSGSVDIAEPLADSAIQAEIDAASFRTGNDQRDQSVLSARFLNAARFGVISFQDGQVGADGKTIRGTLTVRDVARPVSLFIGQLTADGQSFTATATVRVDRTEFGVTAMPGLAGRYLDLTAEVRCTRGSLGETAHA